MPDLNENLDRLLEPVEAGQPEPVEPKRTKAEWRPGFSWNGADGEVTTEPIPGEERPDWSSVLAVFELNAAEYDVVEPVLFNAWHGPSPDGPILYRQWKARVVRKTPASSFDLDEFIREVKKDRPVKRVGPSGDGAFVVMCSDWQIGKADGDGLEGTVKRIVAAIEDVERRVRELRRLGRSIGTLFVLWSGDSVEGCVGHYENQTATIALPSRRDQVKVARRLLRDALKAWAPLFEKVVVVAVAGNHGENRNGNGKAFTALSDNDDLAIVEQVAEAFAENTDRYGHVEFVIPRDVMSVTVEAAGWVLGLTHGHVAKNSGTPEQKLRRWFEQQAAGRAPVGSSDVLASGHYHSLAVADWGSCLWIQAPALDGGSDWWRHRRGEAGTAGVLTWAMYPGVRLADLHLLSYERGEPS